HNIAGARFVEAKTETQHPVGVRTIATRSDLAGERGLVVLGSENPTGERYLLAQRPLRQRWVALHLLAGARVVLGLVTNDHLAHVSSPPVIAALRRLGVPARPISESRPQHKRPARPRYCRPPRRPARAVGRGPPATRAPRPWCRAAASEWAPACRPARIGHT